jgi:hypothetical protein
MCTTSAWFRSPGYGVSAIMSVQFVGYHIFSFCNLYLLNLLHLKNCVYIRVVSAPRWLSRYIKSLRVGRFGDRIPVVVGFFAPALEPTQLPVQWVSGLFLGWQRGRGVAMTTNPNSAPRSKKEYSYITSHPLGLRGLLEGEFYRCSCL